MWKCFFFLKCCEWNGSVTCVLRMNRQLIFHARPTIYISYIRVKWIRIFGQDFSVDFSLAFTHHADFTFSVASLQTLAWSQIDQSAECLCACSSHSECSYQFPVCRHSSPCLWQTWPTGSSCPIPGRQRNMFFIWWVHSVCFTLT